MKTILLVCSAGMSTSLLVTKMEAAAKDAGVECKIFALPFSDAPRVLEEVDCILHGIAADHAADGFCVCGCTAL